MEPIDVNPLGLPPNSKNLKEKPKLEALNIQTRTKKKPWYKRAADTFIVEDTKSIKSFIIHDVIIPTLKDTFYEVVMGSLGMALYQDTKARGGRRRSSLSSSDRTYISYGDISTNGRSRERDRSRVLINRIDIDDLIVDTANEAHLIIDALCDRIEMYEEATVQDLYDLRGVSAPRTAMYQGWKDLSTARVHKVPEGWLVELPKPIPLK